MVSLDQFETWKQSQKEVLQASYPTVILSTHASVMNL